MDAALLAQTLARRATWRARDRWTAQRLRDHQQRALRDLRRRAYARSPFYRRHHAGLLTAPLHELPPVTKAELMEAFDEAVTVPGLRLADVENRLRALTEGARDPGRPWRTRWWVAATSGTTGRRGVFIWDRAEWATVLASYARANDWAGLPVGVRHPMRMAVVSSLVPSHQSAAVGASLASALVPTLRIDATAPLLGTVTALNDFGPRLLVGYASALRELAAEQRAGRLHIAPEAVMSASEVLSPAVAGELAKAWGREPFDVYAATETAGIASPCQLRGRHLYEDLVVCEVVDDAGSPVAAGTTGARLLVTVLFARTLPLIRYEMTDRVSLAPGVCPCGRPFRLLGAVEGRRADILVLPGRDGTVRVHPNVLHGVLDDVAVAGWQVVQESAGLRVLVTAPTRLDTPGLSTRLRLALESAGAAAVPLDVRQVHVLPRTALGKTPLVRALPEGDESTS
ncbi:phenylacetate--CoA ligase family protein [Georgenia yuyongxinii]